MKTKCVRLSCFAIFCGVYVHAGDWWTSLSTKAGGFPPMKPVTANYEFGWSDLKAAEASARFSSSKGRFRLELDAKTVGVVRGLWRMDAHAVSTANARTLVAVRLEQSEKYARKSFQTTVDFSAVQVERLRVPTPPDKTPAKPKRFKLAPVHDLHSALLFIRSQRLKDGDTVRLCVYPATDAYFAEIDVVGREKLRAAGKEWEAIKCEVRLREVEKNLALIPHAKFKKAFAWLSDDKDRLLLRIEAEVFVGSIWAELKSANFSK